MLRRIVLQTAISRYCFLLLWNAHNEETILEVRTLKVSPTSGSQLDPCWYSQATFYTFGPYGRDLIVSGNWVYCMNHVEFKDSHAGSVENIVCSPRWPAVMFIGGSSSFVSDTFHMCSRQGGSQQKW